MGNGLNDPRYGTARVLRPYTDFEDQYEGQLAVTPIMLTEQGTALDKSSISGTEGYDPNLLKGLPVSFGQQVTIFLPTIGFLVPDEYYTWFLIWRMRNLLDYLSDKKTPYQLPKSGLGQPYTGVPNPGSRYVLPAAYEVISYTGTETTQGTPAEYGDHWGTHVVYDFGLTYPINPNGQEGVFQQGVYDSGLGRLPWFFPIKRQALGNELLIGVYRPATTHLNWSFGVAQPDNDFSQLLGSGSGQEYPNVGVYVVPGVD